MGRRPGREEEYLHSGQGREDGSRGEERERERESCMPVSLLHMGRLISHCILEVVF